MPRYRSFPTELLENPDVIEAGSDVQAILFLLGLSVDDEGRGIAHSGMLARKFNKDSEVIERALSILMEGELIVLYKVGRHRYFQICQWHRWQSLNKKTPSKHPAPPDAALPQDSPDFLGNPAESSPQEKGREEEMNQTEGEEEVSDDTPHNVVTFPANRTESDTTCITGQTSVTQDTLPHIRYTMQEVAAIVRLPQSDALLRIVQDYQQDPLLHLLGEADAAREYIDDPRRNRHKQRMSPAFFRRWLRREHEDAAHRQSQRHAMSATGTTGGTPRAAPPGPERPVLPKSLMHLADQAGLGQRSASTKGGPDQ